MIPNYIHCGRLGLGYQSDDGSRIFKGTHGIFHALNESGFREMGERAAVQQGAVRIVAIGCSYTFGYGLDITQTWLWKFADLIENIFSCKTQCINLAVPGASNDYIVRQVTELAEALNPHIVLVAFAQKERLEHWNSSSKVYSIRPGAPSNPRWSEERIELQKTAEKFSTRSNDFRRLYQAVQSTSALCKVGNAMLLYSYASVTDTPSTEIWAPTDGYVGIPFPKLDLAGDGLHPGPKSNSHLALKTFAHFCAKLRSPNKIAHNVRAALGPLAEIVDLSSSESVSVNGCLEQWKNPA